MHKINESWIPLLINKITTFLFILAFIVFITYIIGNFQIFLDSTQLILLHIFESISIIFILIGFYHIFFSIMDIINVQSKKKIINIGLIITGELIIISIYILVKLIIVITKTVN